MFSHRQRRIKKRFPAALAVSTVALLALGAASVGNTAFGHDDQDKDQAMPVTPIKHVIVMIGENRSFDHVFGTYQPRHGEKISNLLSKGIVRADGTPGRNFVDAAQVTVGPQPSFFIGVTSGKSPYQILPPPDTNGAPQAQSTTAPPFTSVATVAAIEPALEPQDQVKLSTGATGLPPKALDTRVPNATTLPNGPFQLSGPVLDDDDYTGDTTHRFYQNWQQFDCSVLSASKADPSGCLKDLFPYVITTFSTNDNGVGNSMAFFNVNDNDAAFFRALADQYTMSDNFHQSFMGGTAANHVMLGHADDVFWSDGKGHPIQPPANVAIANPNPKPNTNNNYTVDGNWSNCSDTTQPGVAPIVNYLKTLPYEAAPNCAPGAFYMLNNVNPGFAPNGVVVGGTTVPPSSVRSIGDALIEKNISWVYYGGAYNAAVKLANINPGNLAAAAALDPADAVGVAYCQICNPFQYDSSIMADPKVRTAHVKDVTDLFQALQDGSLPSVSFVKPDGLLDGHPASSKIDLFEAMVKDVLDRLAANPKLQAETAVIITFDEGGGYYDSGFAQPLDFFGDSVRIPLIVISPFTKGGKITHSYTDHVSIVKFIERNWRLKPLTDRSRDNLPNPIAHGDNPYVPVNMPAIGDLFDMFKFDGDQGQDNDNDNGGSAGKG